VIKWIKSLGVFFGTLVAGVMAIVIALLLPIIGILTLLLIIVIVSGWLGQQYFEYCKKDKPK